MGSLSNASIELWAAFDYNKCIVWPSVLPSEIITCRVAWTNSFEKYYNIFANICSYFTNSMALIYQNVTLPSKHRTKLKHIFFDDDFDLANLVCSVF